MCPFLGRIPVTVDARTTYQVQQEGFHAVVLVMGHGNGVGIDFLPYFLKPSVT